MFRFDRDGLSFGPKVEQVHRPHELVEQSFGTTVFVYLGVLCGIVGASIGGVKFVGIHPLQTGLVLLGIIYLLGAIGHPRALYLALRASRQLARVSDPRTIRRRLLVAGVVFLALGLIFPWPWQAFLS